ncbi:MAG: 50S ribosomal protein L25 [Dehalococcoidia bacterium]|nr:50S ribosomal protein L25 [Dehalococcoidia bacterium]
MAETTVAASRREILGKRVRHLRRAGQVPASIYGHRKESLALQVAVDSLAQAIKAGGSSTIIDVAVEGEARPRPALIKRIQRHPVTDVLLHVDFYQVSMTERMTADVPLVLIGEPPAVKDFQGVLVQQIDSVSIRSLPGDLPQNFEVDISSITELDQGILVGEMKLPDGVELLSDPDQLIVRVEAPRVSEEPTTVAEAEATAAEEPAAEEATEE